MRLRSRGARGWVLVLAAAAVSCSTDPAVAKKAYLEKGDAAFKEQRYSEATVAYKNALQRDPLFGEARYKLAQSYDRLGDRGNAAREYVRAADLLPDNADAQIQAGLALLAAGSFEDAQARARKALARAPRNVDAHLLLAQALAGVKDLAAGEAQVEEAIRMDPDQPRSYIGLGVFRQAQGDPKRAEESFKQAVSVDPKSVDATLALAQFYVANGRQEAEEWLIKAVALAPDDPYTNRALALFYIAGNRLPEAEKPLQAFAKASPNAGPRLLLADYYFATARRSDARTLLDGLLKDESAFSEVRQRLSVLEFNEGRGEAAHRWIDEILSKNNKDPRAAELKGRFLLFEGQFAGARDAFKASLASNPNSASTHYWLGVTLLNLNEVEAARTEFSEVQRLAPKEVGSKIQLAKLHLLDGHAAAAATLVNEALAIEPGNGQARMTLVDVLIAQGNLTTAAKEATIIATNAPNAPSPQMQLGRIFMKQGDYAAAERAFQRAIQLTNGAVDAVGALVETKIAAGRLADARSIVEEHIAKNPKKAWLHIYASRVYKAEGDLGKAEAALRTALANDSDNLAAYLDLTRLYIAQNKLDDVRGQLEAIVARQPKAVWAHTLIGMSLQVQNRLPEAKQRYEKIVEMDPEAAIASNNLAVLLADAGENLDRALNLAQAAMRQLPESPEVNDTIASVYIKQGLGSSAIPHLELSVRKEPASPTFQYHLGQAYALAGQKAKARTAFERALTLNPGFDGSQEARRQLAQLTANR